VNFGISQFQNIEPI